MLSKKSQQNASVCQKCGHTGFQEVMIYCRQCWKNCEHKYCLYKFPRKGEKVRWFCEECRPTIFPISSPDKLDVDTDRSKDNLKSTQTRQNQKQNHNQDQNQDQCQNQKTKGQSVSSISQLEKVQEGAKNMKSPSSDLMWKPTRFQISSPDKLEADTERRKLDLKCTKTVQNQKTKDQSVSSTSQLEKVQEGAKSMKSPSSDLKWEPTIFPLSSPDKLDIDIERSKIFPLSSPDKLDIDTERSKIDLKCTQTLQNQKTKDQSVSSISQLEKVQEEAKSMESPSSDLKWKPTIFPISSPDMLMVTKRSKIGLKCTQNLQNQDQNQDENQKTKGQSISSISQLEKAQEEFKSMKSSSSDFGESGKSKNPRRPILSNKGQVNQNVPNTPLTYTPPPTTCGEITAHEVSVPETIVRRNNGHQEIAVYNPEYYNQITPLGARPIINYVWRGCISFGDGEFVPFRAHGSTLACQRVFDAAMLLPPILPMNKYLRCDLYQTIFKNGPPTNDKIGLYIFPDSFARSEHVFRLIDEIIKKDLMFVYTFDEVEVEMLVFPSCILPEEHHKFQDQYYLWGAFRKKQLSITVTPANNNSEPTIEHKENRQNKQEVLTCSESQKTVANAKKKQTENGKIHGNNLISLITEKKNLTVDGVNKKRVREESENLSKNFISSDTENRKSFEEISKKYKQEEMTTSSPSKCIEKQKHDEVTERKLAENKEETRAGTPIGLCAEQKLADRAKQQSKDVIFSNNYVSDFYRKRKTGETTNRNFARDDDEKQRLLVENEKKHRQEEDEINANNAVSSTCTGEQKPVRETIKKSSQNKEKLCPSSHISKSTEMQKLADESMRRERNRLCTEKQKLSDGSKKLMANRDEIHSNGNIKSAAEKQKHIYELRKRDQDRNEKHASNPNNLAAEKQKPAYDLKKKFRIREENSRASIPIRKCTENQKLIDKSKECNKRVGERDETRACMKEQMIVDKSKLKEKKKDVEHATTTIRTCTKKQKQETNNKLAHKPSASSSIRTCAEKHKALEDTNKKLSRCNGKICDETPIRTCVQKPKQDKEKENCHGEVDEIIASKQLPLGETKKKHVDDGNEIASTPLLSASPTPENEFIGMSKSDEDNVKKDKGVDAETFASNPIEDARKKHADNEDENTATPMIVESTEIQICSEDKMEYIDETQASPVHSTCTEEEKARENMKNFDQNEELEEGELCNESVERDEGEINESGYNNNEANNHCLRLFPLGVEDMGVVSKVGGGDKLNLDLGLGCN